MSKTHKAHTKLIYNQKNQPAQTGTDKRSHMKHRIKLALIASLITSAIAPTTSFAQVTLDKTIAVVAGEPIAQSELNERIKINREVAKRNNQKVTDAELLTYTRDELINERLLLNKVKNAHIQVPAAQIEQALQSMAQGNGMSIDQFKTRVSKDGANAWDLLVRDLNNQIAIDTLMQREILSKIKEPTDKEISAEVERVVAIPEGPMSPQPAAIAQHIFIKTPNAASLKKIQGLKARLDKGEDFAEVAKANSDNPQTAQNGGRVPYILLNDKDADPAILKLAATAPLNTVSAPVKTKNGYHLFKFSDRVTLSPNDEEKKAMAKDALNAMRQKEAAEQFYKELDESKKNLVELKN